MSVPSPQDPEPGAEQLLTQWLARRGTEDELDLELLCRQHPGSADELRVLHSNWVRVAAMIELQALGQERSEPDSHPGQGRGLPAEGSSVAWLLSRLADRSESPDRLHDEAEIAHSAMARVVRVWDIELERPLAKKIVLSRATPLDDSDVTPPQARQLVRFLREARTTARLDHPGIVPVHDVGLDDDGHAFFTMKLVEGKTLHEVFDELSRGAGGWTQTRVLGLILKTCEAMSYAHAKGVIHRDLKPANVMVGRFGEVYVMDWGLAKLLGHEDEKDIRIRGESPQETVQERLSGHGQARESPESPLCTMDGDVVGTPAYMPPEQAEGRVAEVGPHSDVYAVGAMLYHLLVGHMPYLRPGQQADSREVWRRVKAGPPPELEREAAGTPAELVAICERAMARASSARYTAMAALAEDLRAYLEHRVVGAHRTGVLAELRKWVERNKLVAATVAAAVAVLILSSVIFVFGITSAHAETSGALVRTRALGLASASDQALEVDGMEALLLARKAVDLERTPETLSSLHRALGAVREQSILRQTESFGLAVFSPGGDEILATTTNKAVLWDPELDRTTNLEGHARWLLSACFSPSGDRVLTSSQDGTARLWNLGGEELAQFTHDDWVWAATFTPDGLYVLTASEDHTAKLWDQNNDAEPLAVLGGHAGAVLCAAISPDGRHVVTGSTDSIARLWKIRPEDGAAEHVADLAGHEGVVSVVSFSPTSDQVVTGSGRGIWTRGWKPDDTARVWDLEGNQLAVLSGHEGGVESVAFSPDGTLVLTGSSDRTGRLWAPDGSEFTELTTPRNGMVWMGAFSPDGRRVALACTGGNSLVYDLFGRQVGALNGHKDAAMSICFSPNSRWLTTASIDGTVRRWRSIDEKIVTFHGHDGQVDCARYAPGGTAIATASRDRTARIWSPLGEPLAVLRGHRQIVHTVEFSPDGAFLVTSGADNSARLWDFDGNELRVLQHEPKTLQVLCASFSPRGDRIATGCADGSVTLWEVEGAGSQRFQLQGDYALNVEFTPDGEHLLVARGELPALVLTLEDGSTRSLGYRGRHATLSPAGDLILISSTDGAAVVLSFDGELLEELGGHGGLVTWGSFSDSGEWIVTASVDGTARIWSADGTLEANLRGHAGAVRSAVFSPRGDRILTASADGTARTWVADTEEALRLADRRIIRDFEPDELVGYEEFLDLPAREARELVDRLLDELVEKERIIAHLRQASGLDDPLRETALRMAEALIEGP